MAHKSRCQIILLLYASKQQHTLHFAFDQRISIVTSICLWCPIFFPPHEFAYIAFTNNKNNQQQEQQPKNRSPGTTKSIHQLRDLYAGKRADPGIDVTNYYIFIPIQFSDISKTNWPLDLCINKYIVVCELWVWAVHAFRATTGEWTSENQFSNTVHDWIRCLRYDAVYFIFSEALHPSNGQWLFSTHSACYISIGTTWSMLSYVFVCIWSFVAHRPTSLLPDRYGYLFDMHLWFSKKQQ